MKKANKSKKALANFIEEVNKPQEIDEKMEGVMLKIHEVYSNVIKQYLATPCVIQYNYLENLKNRTKKCTTSDEFSVIVKSDIEIMKANKERSVIEEIEFKMAKKVLKDVVEGKGKEFEYGHDLSFKYDDQDIKYIGYFDMEQARKEKEAKNAKA